MLGLDRSVLRTMDSLELKIGDLCYIVSHQNFIQMHMFNISPIHWTLNTCISSKYKQQDNVLNRINILNEHKTRISLSLS